MNRYDYVIIGSGTAGSAAAWSLSERTDARILVVEAGHTDVPDEIDDPLKFAGFFGSRYDGTTRAHPIRAWAGAACRNRAGALSAAPAISTA